MTHKNVRKNARIDEHILDLFFEGRLNPATKLPKDATPAEVHAWFKAQEHRTLATAARRRAHYDVEEAGVAEYHDAEVARLEAELAAGRGRKKRKNPLTTSVSSFPNEQASFQQGVQAVASDPFVEEWLKENAFGETAEDSLAKGGCLAFAFGLANADERFSPYGLGYANLLVSHAGADQDVDDDEASYEHVVAFDRESGLYWDAKGAHTRKDLLKDYALDPSFRKIYGKTVIEPFNPEQPLTIAYDEEIEKHIGERLRPFLSSRKRRNPGMDPGDWVTIEDAHECGCRACAPARMNPRAAKRAAAAATGAYADLDSVTLVIENALANYGLSMNNILAVKFTRGGKSRGGACSYSRSLNKCQIMFNGLAWPAFTEEQRLNTVLHEAAHAIQFLTTGTSDHGPKWQKIARSIGCSGDSCMTLEASQAMVDAYAEAKGLEKRKIITREDAEAARADFAVGDYVSFDHKRERWFGKIVSRGPMHATVMIQSPREGITGKIPYPSLQKEAPPRHAEKVAGVDKPAPGESLSAWQARTGRARANPAAAENGRYFFVMLGPDSTYENIQALQESEKEVSRPTFAKAIGPQAWREIQANLGYDRDFSITKDGHVGYYKGVFRGVPCYFLWHSGIEHIYTLNGKLGSHWQGQPDTARRRQTLMSLPADPKIANVTVEPYTVDEWVGLNITITGDWMRTDRSFSLSPDEEAFAKRVFEKALPEIQKQAAKWKGQTAKVWPDGSGPGGDSDYDDDSGYDGYRDEGYLVEKAYPQVRSFRDVGQVDFNDAEIRFDVSDR